jgi:hypothetical protein
MFKIKDEWINQMDFDYLKKEVKRETSFIDDGDFHAQFCGKDLYEIDVHSPSKEEFHKHIIKIYHDKVRETHVFVRCYLDYYEGTLTIVCRKL